MSQWWIHHVEDAELQLELAKTHTAPAKILASLYDAVVAITRAINELETHHDE